MPTPDFSTSTLTKLGAWDWTRTSIALLVRETYHLSTQPGKILGVING